MTFFNDFTVLQVVGFSAMLLFWGVLVRAHLNRKNSIDLTDLLTEYAAGKRRITMSRFTAFAGFCIGSWAFVFCTVGGTLDKSWEGISTFMLVCFGYRVGDSWLKNQRDANSLEITDGK